jgi:uncharacterized protein YebE (UPF0316 family)
MEVGLITSLAGSAWLPLLIFLARIFDVTMGTLRIIFISRGKKYAAPLLGFVETFVWIMVVSQIIRSMSGIWSFAAYAAGFAAGTLVGMLVEERLAIGTLIVRTILPEDTSALVSRLHDAGFGVTCVGAAGAQGPVTIIYTVIKRKNLEKVVAMIHALHPKAFLSIEPVTSAQEGIFPRESPSSYRYAFSKRK